MAENTIVTARTTALATDAGEGRLVRALRDFGDKRAAMLEETTSLEVITYVSSDMGSIAYDVATDRLTGAATPGAITRIRFDGDTLVCVPERQGGVNAGVWQIHSEMVQQAQNYRLQMVKTAFSLVKALRDI